MSSANLGAGFKGILAVTAGVWLWLFFPPLDALKVVSDAPSFIWLLAALVFLELFPSATMRVAGGVAASCAYMVHYFSPHGFGAQWSTVFTEEAQQLPQILVGHISDPLQTHLFLLFVCILYWLIHYASARPRIWMLYNALGALILSTIDGSTSVHPNAAIAGLLLVMVFVLGMVHFANLYPAIMESGTSTARFFIPFLAIIVAGGGVAFALPKQVATWPDPFKAFGTSGAGIGKPVQFVGYQTDDALLGGPFLEDYTPALNYVSADPTYVRGQTLSTYTGKGWVSAGLAGTGVETVSIKQSLPGFSSLVFRNLPKKSMQQTVTLMNNIPTSSLLGGYAIHGYSDVLGQTELVYDKIQGNLHGPSLHIDDSYTLNILEPESPYDALLADHTPFHPATSRASVDSLYPPDVAAYDLQLPNTLPERVRQLAAQLVQGDTTEYAMVTSISRYLQTQMEYQTVDIPVPTGKQDYVDEFLFESHKGYCNNFSSSLAVMLRTQNIPTRWVTGFAQGTLDLSYKGPLHKYTVTSADAHSWVEVYFPKFGWIPFDATPNFSMPFPISPSQTVSQTTQSQTAPSQTKPKAFPTVQPSQTDIGTSTRVNGSAIWNVIEWMLLVFIVAIIVVLTGFRHRVLEWRYLWFWRNAKQGARGSVQPMMRLMFLLKKTGDLPAHTSTLRDLIRPAKSYGIDPADCVHLVRTAEQSWYGNQEALEEDVLKMRSTWRRWIRSIARRGE